jgi:NADPH:quinone reductase-like Zn-dependent oxidoreductase
MTPTTMRAVVLRAPGGSEQLVCDRVATPEPDAGQALVRVHAAALTRDELEWPVDRLPAIPSYELSGVVVALGPGVESLAVGDEVFGLTAFDRDGVAADYAAIPTELLAPKPHSLSHLEAAAGPLAALSAWPGPARARQAGCGGASAHSWGHRRCGPVRHPVGQPPRRPCDRYHVRPRRRACTRARRRRRH